MAVMPLFEGMIESKRGRPAAALVRLLPLVVAMHALVLCSLGLRYYFRIPAIAEPPLRIALAQLAPPPPPPGPALPTTTPPPPPEPQESAPTPAPVPEAPAPDLLLEPMQTPADIDLTRMPEIPDAASAGAGLGGQPQGVAGGVPGGVPGGLGRSQGPSPGPRVRLEPGVAPRRVYYVAPAYPRLAQEAGVAGVVRLEAVIHRDGSVGDIRVLQDLPLGCTEAAIAAVRQWRYEPWRQNGVPVEAILFVEVQFQLQ